MTDRQRDSAEPISSQLVQEDASFADIVEEFLQGMPECIERLEAALAGADFENLRRQAHQLKGSGGGYGYPDLTDLAARVEQHAIAGQLEACAAGLAELKDIVSRMVVSLD